MQDRTHNVSTPLTPSLAWVYVTGTTEKFTLHWTQCERIIIMHTLQPTHTLSLVDSRTGHTYGVRVENPMLLPTVLFLIVRCVLRLDVMERLSESPPMSLDARSFKMAVS